MWDRKLYVIFGLLLFSLAVGFLLVDEEGSKDLNVELNASESVKTTSEGVKYTVNPDKLRRGCPSLDCIPSIDDPNFQTADKADWLNDKDRVIGLEINGTSKAYPLRILVNHEIVNDEISDKPVVITYCPLCRSAVAYSREVGGQTLEFGVSGKLLNANLVMYDRSTQTYWSQIQGEAIIGKRVPQKLDLVFSSITTWGEWREGHPDTKVLSRNTGIFAASSYGNNPYSAYANSSSVGFGVDNPDKRLDSKELVFGLSVGGKSIAYLKQDIKDQGLIQDSVGGKPLAILKRPNDGSVIAFIREYQGEKLNLTLVKDGLRDQEGRVWSFEGQLESGSGELEKLNPKGFYWFAWSKFHPDSEIY